MSIEDITNSRVCKFTLTGSSDQKMRSEFTGIVKRFLDSQIQEIYDDGNHFQLTIWAEVIPSCLKSKIECAIVRTGDEVPKKYQYISTVKTCSDLVFHVYARSNVRK